MSQEFAGMLKDTLETMKNKIEEADKKWEQENDGAMLKRFEEYANPKASWVDSKFYNFFIFIR